MKKATLALILLSCLAAGCVDERNNHMVDDSLTFTARNQLVRTSVYTGSFKAGVYKSGKGFSGADALVDDDAAMDIMLYNKANGTEFKAIPSSQYAFRDNVMDFAADETRKEFTITWDAEKLAESLTGSDAVIPLRLSSQTLVVNPDKDFFMLNLLKSEVSVAQTRITRTASRGETGKAQIDTLTLDVLIDFPVDGMDIDLDFGIDNTLVEAFNAGSDKVYEAAPEGLLKFPSKVTLPAGAGTLSIPLILDKNVLFDGDRLREFTGYVIPLRLTGGSVKGLGFGNTTTYIVVNRSGEGIKALERVWGHYSLEGYWWSGLLDGLAEGGDRTVAMDDNYIYIVNASATPGIFAIDRRSGRFAKKLNTDGVVTSAVTFPLSCARVIPNEAGDDILLVSNLKSTTTGDILYVYAYTHGTDAAPEILLQFSHDNKGGVGDWRRYGDRFTVRGTWQEGELWFHTWNGGGKTVMFRIQNGVVTNPRDPVDNLLDKGDGSIKDVVLYPGLEEILVTSPASAAFFKDSGTANANGWEEWTATTAADDETMKSLQRTFGYHFFTFNEKRYVCYVWLENASTQRGRLILFEDTEGTPAGFKSMLAARPNLMEYPIQHPTDFTAASKTYASSTVGDCDIRVIDGDLYIVALIQGNGLSLFKAQ